MGINIKEFLGDSARQTALWTGVGFFVGHQAETSPELVAAVFAVSMIADKVFSLFNMYTISGNDKKSTERELKETNAVCSVVNAFVTGVVLQRMKLLSSSAAYILGMGSIAYHVFALQQNP